MQFKNTATRFGIVTIFFHWLMTLLIIGMLALGIYMTRIPISLLKLELYGIHKEFGILILILAAIRVSWRVINITPTLASIPRWEMFAARAAHFSLYGFMFALPITGWMLTSAADLPVSFFGWFTLPNLVQSNPTLQQNLTIIHQWLAYGLIVMLCTHITASFKHHFIDNDDILRRILWP